MSTAVRMSALIEVGEFPRRYAPGIRSIQWHYFFIIYLFADSPTKSSDTGVLVHGNPFFIVLPISSSNDELPVSTVYSTALSELLQVTRDINIEDVYFAG